MMRRENPPVTLHTVIEAGISFRYGVVHTPEGAWKYRWALEDPAEEAAYCETVARDYRLWRQGQFAEAPFDPWTEAGPDTGITHDLKLDAWWFDAVVEGRKTVELRREDDRQFQVGDRLLLLEWQPLYEQDPETFRFSDVGHFTGRYCLVRVTHIVRYTDAADLLAPGVVALSIRREPV